MPSTPTDAAPPLRRCDWAERAGEPDRTYHDVEWGVPQHDDRALFEQLCLEGAQAGLSWSTILRKRQGYRQAFEDFVPHRVAAFDPGRIERLLLDPGIVRHRGKITAVVDNARALLALAGRHGSFARFVWDFVGGAPVQNHWSDPAQVPASTERSAAMSRALRQAGFRFVGPTTCYAFMQAAGLVNDHLASCPRHAALGGAAPRTSPPA